VTPSAEDAERPGAGWYPCPTGDPKERWWDGARWTDRERAVADERRTGSESSPVVASAETTRAIDPVTPAAAEATVPVERRPAGPSTAEAERRPEPRRRSRRAVAVAVTIVLLAAAVAAALLLTGTVGGDRSVDIGSGLAEETIAAGDQLTVTFVPAQDGPHLVVVDGADADTDLAVADEAGRRVATQTDDGLEFDATSGADYWIFVVNEGGSVLTVDVTVRRPR
jgi:hypothetical protein